MTPRRRTPGVHSSFFDARGRGRRSPAVRRARLVCVFAVATGVIASSALGLAAPANASPYPSWSDVQAAKGNQAKAEKEISTIDSAISTLQHRAADAGDAASGAGERYQSAVNAEQSAATTVATLRSQQAAAAAKAKLSRQRVGQLVAELSHAGGQQLTMTMLTESKHAHNLLYRLGTITNLTSRTKGLLEQATADDNVASSLSDQATAAQAALTKRTAAASSALASANSAADTASAALAAQTASEKQLIAQVAYLKGTTAAVQTKYYAGLAAGTVADTTPAPAVTKSGGSTAGGGSSGGGTSGGGSTSGSTTPSKAPDPAPSPSKSTTPVTPTKPTTPVAPTKPKPPVTPTPPPSSGSSAAVNTAIAYAKAQLGKAYVFGGAGPNSFDCSGLMMASYSAAGIYIGGHSVRWQYEYLGGEGRLVSISQWKPGDILFYYNASDGYYHDAMYIGGGQMLEAPNPSARVRIVAVRYLQLLNVVGRPVG